MRRFLIPSLLLVAILSCAQKVEEEPRAVSDKSFVSQEKAVAKLTRFLSDTQTKAFDPNSIQSVEAHYSSRDKNSSVPDAYVVNFCGGKGFAILGANTDVDDIVAVTDNGHIDASTLDISFDETKNSHEAAEMEDNAAFVRQIIEYGLNGGGGEGGGDNGGEGGGEGGGNGNDWDEDHPFPLEDEEFGGLSSNFVTRTPMLSYSWSQEDPYNLYCQNGSGVCVNTGCSTTAMAMIVAYNEFPQSMQVNGVTLDWNGMKSAYKATSLPSANQNHVALLMGSIFNFVQHFLLDGTLIFPSEIKTRLEDFGYTNVVKHSSSSLTSDMTWAISDMLRDNKPVFISAVPSLNFSNAHSWVVDGAKYYAGTYLLHFNFGWHGLCNGYFSRSCLNPTQGLEYDSNYEYNSGDDYTYNWHFRVITYDIPSGFHSMQVVY